MDRLRFFHLRSLLRFACWENVLWFRQPSPRCSNSELFTRSYWLTKSMFRWWKRGALPCLGLNLLWCIDAQTTSCGCFSSSSAGRHVARSNRCMNVELVTLSYYIFYNILCEMQANQLVECLLLRLPLNGRIYSSLLLNSNIACIFNGQALANHNMDNWTILGWW